jgi:hypothetical protein
MADRKAVANGIWGDTATWDGGTLPADTDDVYANNFQVTINTNRTAASVRTTSGGTVAAVAGGKFIINDAVTLTANVIAGTTVCVDAQGPNAMAIVGNVTGGSSAGAYGAQNNNDGTLTITGVVTGGTNATAQGVQNTGTGSLVVNGNPVNTAQTNAIQNAGTGSVTVTGNLACTAACATSVLNNAGGGPVTINGNVTGGTVATGYGINLAGAGSTLTVNGLILGGNATTTVSAPGVIMSGTGCTVNAVNPGSVAVRGGPTGTAQYGILTVSSGDIVNVTGDVEGGASAGVLGVAGSILTVTGTSFGAAAAAGAGLSVSGTATVNGAATGRQGSGVLLSTGSVTVNGPVSGGSVSAACGITTGTAATGSITVVGNVMAGSAATTHGINTASTQPLTITVTGNVTGGSSTGMGLANGGAATNATITGNCMGGTASTSVGASNTNTGSLVIFGDAIGGTLVANYGAQNTGAGALTIWGTGRGSNTGTGAGHGVNIGTSVNSFVQIAQGNNYPNDGLTVASAGVTGTSAAGAVTVDAIVNGSGGYPGTQTVREFMRPAGTNYVTFRDSNLGTQQVLGENDDYPVPANVRSGISYNFGAQVGTCAVPPAGSVAFGVAVDATTGTAALNQTALLGADLVARMEECATVATTGAQLAALSNT